MYTKLPLHYHQDMMNLTSNPAPKQSPGLSVTLVFTRLLHNSRTIMRSFPPLYASDLVVHSDMDLGHEIWPVFVSCLGVC